MKLLSFPLASENGFGLKINAVFFNEPHKTESLLWICNYCCLVKITIIIFDHFLSENAKDLKQKELCKEQ